MATPNTITPNEALYNFMRDSGVPNYWYLFERSWFMHSPDLKLLVVKAILQGRAHQIYVCAGDFREHIMALTQNDMNVDI
jgi:hypothetical protein